MQLNLDFLPLKSYANIIEGNSLQIDWNTVIPKEKLSYIVENPPFIGEKEQKPNYERRKEETSVFFIDLDTVIMNPQQNSKDIEKLKNVYCNRYLREWEVASFNQLSDDEILIMSDWDKEWCRAVQRLRPEVELAIIFFSKHHFEFSHLDTMLKINSFYYMSHFIQCADNQELIQSIKKQTSLLEDSSRFVVLSMDDYRDLFYENAVYLRSRDKNGLQYIKNRINRLLCGNVSDYFAWYSSDERDEEYNEKKRLFSRVIFLDIDGVLNNEGEEYRKGLIIDPSKVKLLKHIVQETDAEIILTSSWKRGYKEFIMDGRHSYNENFNLLKNLLESEHLKICGITPISQLSGSVARPYEIRQWLCQFPDIFSYVIL